MNDSQRARFTRWLNTTHLPIPYQMRIKALDHLVGTRPARAIMQGTDLQMELDLADALQANMYLDGYWDRKLSNWQAFFAARSRVMADIGAHVGYFTLLMSHYGGIGAMVHAFEPNIHSFTTLRRNIANNNLAAVAHQLAIARSSGKLPMHIPHRFLSGATRASGMAHARETVTVDAISVDEYCQQRGLPGFDLIKMDIEGGEVQAIAGMESGLHTGQHGIMFIELHVSILPIADSQSIYDRLLAAGYRVYRVIPDRLVPSITVVPGTDYHCCAISPRAFANLGSPHGDFCLPADANLPFPIGVE